MLTKARGIIVIDYDFDGDARAMVEAQTALEEAVRNLMKGRTYVLRGDCDLRERRERADGTGDLNVKDLKLQARTPHKSAAVG